MNGNGHGRPPSHSPPNGNGNGHRNGGPGPSSASSTAGPNDLGSRVRGRGRAGPNRASRMEWLSRDDNVTSGSFNNFQVNLDSIKGQPVNLVTNAVVLHAPDTMDKPFGQQYHVGFKPDVENKRLRIKLVRMHSDQIGGPHTVYDGGSQLYAHVALPPQIMFEESVDGKPIQITISKTSEVFNSKNSEYHRLLNVLMRRSYDKIGMHQIDRHYYNPKQAYRLDQANEVWPGVSSGINQFEGGLLLVMDTQFKLASTRSVYDLMGEFWNQSRGDGNHFKDTCHQQLVGRVIFAPHNQKRYKIDDIDFNKTPMDRFMKGDQKVSFVEYYERQYGYRINYEDQPLIISQPKAREFRNKNTQGAPPQPILLIPEMCYVTGISEEQKKDFRFKQELDKYTKLPPQRRAETLLKMVSTLNRNQEVVESLENWGVRPEPKLAELKGCKLRSPDICFKELVEYRTDNADFQGCLRNARFRVDITIRNCAVFFQQENQNLAEKLIDGMKSAGRNFGMRFDDIRRVKVRGRNGRPQQGDWVEHVQGTIADMQGNLQLVVVVLPDNRADRYCAIKRVCLVDQPVASQCVLQRTLGNQRGFMSVVSKLLLQMNVKLAGEPWIARLPIQQGLMVMGMDVHHSGKGKNRKSQVGIVASINNSLTRYYSRVYENNDEFVSCLQSAVTSCVKQYYKYNNRYPDQIAFFRDGVGEGQLSRVQTQELGDIKNALKDMGVDTPVCLLVVSKRIPQRFFLKDNRNQLQNPQPGTVVFNTVTKPNRFDFFLTPCTSRFGTVTPTHYNVVHDETIFRRENGKLMELAFALCFMYYNWTGAIRVPNVCQYAHKLAFLAGTALDSHKPDLRLADTLYYL